MKRTTIHDGPRFRLERLEYTAPGGSAQVRDIVRHPGAVVIVPILDPRTLALIRNRRVAVGTTLWELPAGTLEPREAPAQCAQRGYTLVPLRIYFREGWAKVELGLARAKNVVDKRQQARARENRKDIERALGRAPRRR